MTQRGYGLQVVYASWRGFKWLTEVLNILQFKKREITCPFLVLPEKRLRNIYHLHVKLKQWD